MKSSSFFAPMSTSSSQAFTFSPGIGFPVVSLICPKIVRLAQAACGFATIRTARNTSAPKIPRTVPTNIPLFPSMVSPLGDGLSLFCWSWHPCISDGTPTPGRLPRDDGGPDDGVSSDLEGAELLPPARSVDPVAPGSPPARVDRDARHSRPVVLDGDPD